MSNSTTDAALAYWRGRHKTGGQDWAARYWEDTAAPHRAVLMQAFADLDGPLERILELGCNAGPNLRLLHKAYPDAGLWGLDASAHALAYAGGRAADEGWLFHQIEGDLREFVAGVNRVPEDARYDVVFSCYALAYTDPAEIRGVIEAMWWRARRAVIIAEPMLFYERSSERIEAKVPTWRHDYLGMLRNVALEDPRVTRYLGTPAMTFFPVAPAVQELNGVALLHKGLFRANTGRGVVLSRV